MKLAHWKSGGDAAVGGSVTGPSTYFTAFTNQPPFPRVAEGNSEQTP